MADAGGVTLVDKKGGSGAGCPIIRNFDDAGTPLNTILDTMQTAIDVATAADTAFGALADGKIIVGNGAGVATDVVLSGDATITNTGALTIGVGVVDEAMLVVPSGDGLHAKRTARATYDFAVDGGVISTIGLGVTLPDNAIVTRSWYEVITTFTSATDAATVALTIPTDDVAGILAAIAISNASNVLDAGYREGIQSGTAANFAVKTTAARELSLTIAVEAVTAGKMILFCEYVVTE